MRLNLYCLKRNINLRGPRPLRPNLLLKRVEYFVDDHVKFDLCIFV